jgi:hypothetical protein
MRISQNSFNGFAKKYQLRPDPIERLSWDENASCIYRDMGGKLFMQAHISWHKKRDFVRVRCGLYGKSQIGVLQERSFATWGDAFEGIKQSFDTLSNRFKEEIAQETLSEPAYIPLEAMKQALKVCNCQKDAPVEECDSLLAALASSKRQDNQSYFFGSWYRSFEDRWMLNFVTK